MKQIKNKIQRKLKIKRLIETIVCIASVINNISVSFILLMLFYDLVLR